MVDAQIWLEQNYPVNGTCQRQEDKENYGKKRIEITNLDVSNQGLENNLDIHEGFINLRKLNASFNKISSFLIPTYIDEIDFSHNQFNSFNITGWLLKKFNISSNHISSYGSSFFDTPNLTHLDCSNNSLTELDLRKSPKLVELKCSDNPLTNLSLSSPSNLETFDCLGIKLVGTNISYPSITTTTTVTNNSNTTAIATAIPSGTLLLVTSATAFYYRWQQKKTLKLLNTKEQPRELAKQKDSNEKFVSLSALTGKPEQSHLSKLGMPIPRGLTESVEEKEQIIEELPVDNNNLQEELNSFHAQIQIPPKK